MGLDVSPERDALKCLRLPWDEGPPGEQLAGLGADAHVGPVHLQGGVGGRPEAKDGGRRVEIGQNS